MIEKLRKTYRLIATNAAINKPIRAAKNKVALELRFMCEVKGQSMNPPSFSIHHSENQPHRVD
jgi:signal recognition particle subunit SEC65